MALAKNPNVTDVTPKKIRVNGSQVTYWDYHPEQSTILIFLHGFRGNHHGLIEVAQSLANVRVIVPDLPGYGLSEPFNHAHNFSAYAAWFNDFIKALGVSRFHLAGHSYGATLAIVIASHRPTGLQRLMLVTPVVSSNTFVSRLGRWYYTVAAHLPLRLQRLWMINAPLNRLTTELLTTTHDRQLKKKIVADEQNNLPFVIPRVEIESFLGFFDLDLPAAAARVIVPTLFVAAERDQMTQVQISHQLAQKLATMTLTTLPGEGHFVPMEDPAALVRVIATYLAV